VKPAIDRDPDAVRDRFGGSRFEKNVCVSPRLGNLECGWIFIQMMDGWMDGLHVHGD